MDSIDNSANWARKRILTDRYLKRQYQYLFEELIAACNFDQISRLKVIEIGAAGGITKELFPWISTVDVRSCQGVDLVADAKQLSNIIETFDVLLAKDTLHHLSDVELFLKELEKIMRPDSIAVFLEPNWNFWSRFIYKYLHPENWDSKVKTLTFTPLDPMHSNQAIPYILFVRDAAQFDDTFPNLRFEVLKPINGVSYLLSGGVNKRTFFPSNFLNWISRIERRSRFINRFFGLNRIIKITRV